MCSHSRIPPMQPQQSYIDWFRRALDRDRATSEWPCYQDTITPVDIWWISAPLSTPPVTGIRDFSSLFFLGSFLLFFLPGTLDGRTKRTKTSGWWIRFILWQDVFRSYFKMRLGRAEGGSRETRLPLGMLIPVSTTVVAAMLHVILQGDRWAVRVVAK